jgi:arginine N-succinyltransferase
VLIVRPAQPGDLSDLVALAAQLDSVNLPSDPDFLADRVELSAKSFAREVPDEDAVHLLMLEDTTAGRCVGSSCVIAKTGRPGVPFYWLEVSTEERRSPDLDRRFVHTKLRLRSTEDGPTEVGGLILDPAYRRHPQRCGKALSIARFALISAHPERFEQQVIAEMLSPFVDPGRNLLWDAFGARFTGLTYREADRLSARNKQFIADLFPRDPVYATLFPEDVRNAIGQTHEAALAAVRILEKIGFHPLDQVDPFDGGPYYGAARDAIRSVRERRELVLPGAPMGGAEESGVLGLLTAEAKRGFRSTVIPLDAEGAPVVSPAHREALGVTAGDRVSVTPLP